MEYGRDAGINHNPDQRNPNAFRYATAVPTLLAIIVITFAAIAIDPESTVNPLSTNDGRAYLLIVVAVASALGFWRGRYTGSGHTAISRQAAQGFLVAIAPALFLIGRIGLISILLILALAVGIAFTEDPVSAGSESATASDLLSVFALGWFALVGINSLEIRGRVQFPLVAVVAIAAAVWLTSSPSEPAGRRGFAVTTGVIGLELSVATSFFRITPYTEATLWMFGLVLVGAGYLMSWRTVNP